MKEKNISAVALGKLSAKSRLRGMNKKQKAAAMKKVWQLSIVRRKERSLDKKSETVLK